MGTVIGLKDFCEKNADKSLVVSVDTETTGLSVWAGDSAFLVSLTDEDMVSSFFRFRVDPKTRRVKYEADAGAAELLKGLLPGRRRVIMHNAKFDEKMLRKMGVRVDRESVVDTLILAKVWAPDKRAGLKPLSEELLGHPQDDMADLKRETAQMRRLAKKAGWALAEDAAADYWMVPADTGLVERYAVGDTERTMGLWWFFEDMYESPGPEYRKYREICDMEHAALWALASMEDRGICVDSDKVAELRTYYEGIIAESDDAIAALGYGSLNTSSPKQMIETFYGEMGFAPQMRVRKSKTGEKTRTVSCDAKALEKIGAMDPDLALGAMRDGILLARSIIRKGEAEHQLSSFISVIERELGPDGRLHPNYNSLGAVTGRISCDSPNLMNVSNTGTKKSDVEYRVREVFVPDSDKVLLFADYDQVEVWLSMFLSGDLMGMGQLMLGADMHGDMARYLWESLHDLSDPKVFKKRRKMAKFCLFGLIYGSGAPALMDTAQCGIAEAERIRSAFWGRYVGLAAFQASLSSKVRQSGRIENVFGRVYSVDKDSPHKALNYAVQGTAAELMKRALINLENEFSEDRAACVLLTIHDEVCVETDPSELKRRRPSAIARRLGLKGQERGFTVPERILLCMQDRFHEIVGIPRPFSAGVDLSYASWADKHPLDVPLTGLR